MLPIAKMAHFPEKFKEKLQVLSVNTLALQCGFVQREPRKIDPHNFIVGFFLMIFNGAHSLSSFAITLGLLKGHCISKQAINKKIKEPLVRFLQSILANALTQRLRLHEKPAHHRLSTMFKRVLIHDSTSIQLDSSLAQHFPGNRNSTTAQIAIVKIQAMFDILSERFRYFSVTPFTTNDQHMATETLHCVQSGDLIIRDLGYFVLRIFREIQCKGAYFISRLKYGTLLFTPDGETQIDLSKMLKKKQYLDIHVCVGAKEKLPARLIALPVSPDVAAKRRRALKHNRDYRLNPTKDHLTLLGWNIFILNVDQSALTAKDVAEIYHLRWRIEIIFKAWKSHFRIADVPYSSLIRVQAYLYVMLIFLTLFHTWIYAQLSCKAYHKHQINLSLLKLSRLFKDHFWAILAFSHHPRVIEQQILYHCKYESRSCRQNFSQQLAALG